MRDLLCKIAKASLIMRQLHGPQNRKQVSSSLDENYKRCSDLSTTS